MTTKANTTTLDSKSGCKSSPGRTPLNQQENAELKFSASNKEEYDSKKPRSREYIALPSEEETAKKRQRRGYSDYKHVQTAVIAVFFSCLCIQFNSFLMQRDKIPQLQCQSRSFEKIPPTRNGFTTKATRRRSGFLKVCSRNSACVP